jgi:CCR4-NOT transcription complex subunit 7/8
MDRWREIRNVWGSNVEEEFDPISRMAERYSYVGLHTEFPGFLSVPFQVSDEQGYYAQTLNVNLLRVVQIGLTLGDASRNVCGTWQFNFRFSPSEDIHTAEAIRIFEKANPDFPRFARDGIDVVDFSHLLLASGLVMAGDIVWVAFHGSYDFAYLLKMLTGGPLPAAEDEFLRSFQLFFPHFYDVRQIAFIEEQRMGGLQDLVRNLDVPRIGAEHQAGSDAYVTLLAFYRLMAACHKGVLRHDAFKNKLFGSAG